MDNKNRIIYLDMLKIISCIFIVIIHVTAPGFYGFKLKSASWIADVSFNLIARFAVPVFVMVSGALFLNENKEIDVKKIWKKNILHLSLIYVFWTLIYAIYSIYNLNGKLSIINVLKTSIKSSYYHLWFIPMLIGIYIIIPLLKPMVKNKKLIEYFLIIFLLLKIIPFTLDLFGISTIHSLVTRIDIPLLSYTGYFVLGHYINTFEIDKKRRKIIYIAGIISYIVSVVGTILFSVYKSKAYETFNKEFSITTFFMSLAIFTLFKYLFKEEKFKEKTQKIIIHLSQMTLGIYVIHAIFRDLLKNQMGLSFTKIYNLPLAFLIIIIASYICTYILSKLPIIKRYLV